MRRLEEKMNDVSQKLVEMGDTMQHMLRSAVKALFSNDTRLARNLFEQENRVNALEREIDEDCIAILALFQPEAHDLRFIASVMHVNNDVERMADHAVNISHRIQDTAGYVLPAPIAGQFQELAETAITMAGDALRALVSRNPEAARGVFVREDQADQLKDDLVNLLLEYSKRGERDFERPLHFILTARDLERVADLATNIAEDVIYMEKGVDVRHRGHKLPRPESPE